MEWLKQLAPLLGTAFGGPLGGAAASFIASKLGLSSDTVEAVTDTLATVKLNPDQIASLKEAEIDFKKFLETNKIDLQKLHNENTKDARALQIATQSKVPGFLAIMIVGGFFAVLSGMMFGWLKTSDEQALLILLGALSAGFGAVLNYYFGSSKASDDRSFMRIYEGKSS